MGTTGWLRYRWTGTAQTSRNAAMAASATSWTAWGPLAGSVRSATARARASASGDSKVGISLLLQGLGRVVGWDPPARCRGGGVASYVRMRAGPPRRLVPAGGLGNRRVRGAALGIGGDGTGGRR